MDEEIRVFQKLRELSSKYSNEGIDLIFEFGKFGLIIIGYIDPVNYYHDIRKTGLIASKKRFFDYEFLLAPNFNLENSVDNFKEDLLEEYKREIEKLEGDERTD